MKKKILIALGIVATIGLVGAVGAASAVGVAAAEGEAAGGRLRHGYVSAIFEDSLSLETRRGEIVVLVDDNTRYRLAGVENPGFDELEVGDHLGLAGRPNEDGTVLARLIIRIPARREIGQLRGELTEKNIEGLTITRPDGVPVSILVNGRTHFRIPEVETPSLDDLKLGEAVFARGLWTDDGQLQAQLVRRLPEGVEDTLTGRVLAVNDQQIEVLTRQGPAVVITSADTQFHVPGVENPSLADIQVDATITAGGTREVGKLRAVAVAVHPERPLRITRRGIVTANTDGQLTLQTPNGNTVTVQLTEQTRLRVVGVTDPSPADVLPGYQALIVGRQTEDGTLLAWGVAARPSPNDN